jgi:hypothetical protein
MLAALMRSDTKLVYSCSYTLTMRVQLCITAVVVCVLQLKLA